MATYRLKPEHPFMKKVDELYAFMEKNGIQVAYDSQGGLKFIDTESNREYALRDNEAELFEANMPEFPTGVEFKLTFNQE